MRASSHAKLSGLVELTFLVAVLLINKVLPCIKIAAGNNDASEEPMKFDLVLSCCCVSAIVFLQCGNVVV